MTPHTWTTVGLSDREQAVLKALMAVVAGKTSAQWQYAEGLVVTLAFCQPESPMARLAQSRHASHGLPYCVSVPRAGQAPLPDTRAMSVRMRVGDFIALLDDISARAQAPKVKRANPEPVREQRAAEPDSVQVVGFELAKMLHEIQSDPVPRARTIEAGDAWLRLYPGSRRYVGSDADVDALCRKLQERGSALQLQPLGEQAADRDSSHPLDELLWACGQTTSDALLPWLPPTARFGLHRWPDFGRLSASSAAISLAAMMVRDVWPLPALVAQAGGDLQEVRRFINGCALLGLLLVETQVAASTAGQQPTITQERLWSGVFGKIRSALRMGRK